MLRLSDVATVTRGIVEPPTYILRHNGELAVGLGISTVYGGNVITMGDSVKERLEQLTPQIPIGIEIHPIAYQAETVSKAVDGFVLNLVEALAIVIILLVIFMGLREGLIIGAILLLTILGTFIGMQILEVNLQRISLGALIIALGMLVDNAIVVVEGTIIKIMRGTKKEEAAKQTVKETQWPLLGATIIAILAFAAISISKDVTGEFLGSLFKVIALSLGLSWVFAITVTPYLCVALLRSNTKKHTDPHDRPFYRFYQGFLGFCIGHRYIFLSAVAVLLILAGYGFQFVDQNFFPDSNRPQYMVDVWFPSGTHIDHTSETVQQMEDHVMQIDGVEGVTSFIGGGSLRYILTYIPQMPNSHYAQILVSTEDETKLAEQATRTQLVLESQFPEASINVTRFKLGPGGGSIEARFSGPDINTLRLIAAQAEDVMRQHPKARVLPHDWGERNPIASVAMAEAQAREAGISRPSIAQSLAMTFSGVPTGVFREGDDLLPIILRPPPSQREGIENLENVRVWSTMTGASLPIEQVVSGTSMQWEDPKIRRLNRSRTLTVSCQETKGTAMNLFNELRADIEAIPLPQGYKLEWGGEYENSTEANQKLMAKVPMAFCMMLLIAVMLFNTLRHPIIIFLGLPLSIIGVTAGLLMADQPFGFMALLGVLSLSGMLIKNEIVLLDQIKLEIEAGKPRYDAILHASVSRVRPVCMAAFTTVLGMVPLLWDVFFVAMAVTIMAGLTFATVLTLVVVPVLYATFFQVRKPDLSEV
jgi:multidrug efflux pump subunit AcrB